jgi:hypothetical protein
MGNNSGDQQYVKDSRKPEVTPEKCPSLWQSEGCLLPRRHQCQSGARHLVGLRRLQAPVVGIPVNTIHE